MKGNNHPANGAGAVHVFLANRRQALVVRMLGRPEPDARRLFLAKSGRLALQALGVWKWSPLAWRTETSR